MKPNFALSLSYEGIRLLHRSGSGWTVVGDVPLESPDLGGALAALRKKGLDLDPGGMRTKIVLPNDQIRYITLDSDQTSEAEVLAALDGTTPYALDELRIDHVRGSGRTWIAAVARETLQEAEAFAAQHRFGPVCFVGVPEAGAYSGEVFFGETGVAKQLLPGGERVERDPVAVNLSGAARGPGPDPLSDVPDPEQPSAAEAALPATAREEGRRAPSRKKKPQTEPEPPPQDAATEPHEPGDRPDDAGDAAETMPQADLPQVAEEQAGARTTGELIGAGPEDGRALGGLEAPAEGASAEEATAGEATAAAPGADMANEAEDTGSDERMRAEPPAVTAASQVPADQTAAALQEPATPEESLGVNIADAAAEAGEVVSDGLAGIGPAAKEAPSAEEQDPDRGADSDSDLGAGLGTLPAAATVAASDRVSEGEGAPETGEEAAAPLQTGPAADAPEPVFASRSRTLRPASPPPATSGPPAFPPLAEDASPPSMPLPAGVTIGPVFVRRSTAEGVTRPVPAPFTAGQPTSAGLTAPEGIIPTPPPGSERVSDSESDSAPEGLPAAPGLSVPRGESMPADRRFIPVGGVGASEGAALSAEATPGRPDPLRAAGLSVGAAPILSPTGAAPLPGAGAGAAPPTFGAHAIPIRRDTGVAVPPALAAALKKPGANGFAKDLPPRYTPSALFQRKAEAPAPETTVPAADKARTRWSNPRVMGLVLTIILLVLMAAVASFAALGNTTVARWLGAGREAEDVAAAPVLLPPPEVLTLDPVAPVASEGGAPLPALATEGAAELMEQVAAPDEPGAPVAPDLEAEADATFNADPAALLPLQQGAAVDPATAAAAAAVALAIADLANTATGQDGTAPPLDAETAAPAPLAPTEAGTPVTPEEADRFYAATGVWLRAPRLPLLPRTEELTDLYLATADTAPPGRDTPPDAFEALALATPDPVLSEPDPPLGPASSIPRDERGFILATPDGTISPRGIALFAAAPPIVPPNRPEDLVPEDAVLSGAEAEEAPIAASAEAATEDPAEATVTEDVAADETEEEIAPGSVGLAGLRPEARPEGLAPPEPEPELVLEFDGPRPPLRPAGLAPPEPEPAPEPEPPPPEPEPQPEQEVPTSAQPADPASAVAATLAAIVESAPDPLAGVTARAPAVSLRPDARPRNFDRVVAQQAARTQPAAEAPAAAAAVTATAPREAPATTAPQAAQPSGPVAGSVARAATIDNAINLREVNLIGVYGRPNDRRALVRLSNGRYQRVAVGDSLDGGQVVSISDTQLNYVKRGRTITLSIPTG